MSWERQSPRCYPEIGFEEPDLISNAMVRRPRGPGPGLLFRSSRHAMWVHRMTDPKQCFEVAFKSYLAEQESDIVCGFDLKAFCRRPRVVTFDPGHGQFFSTSSGRGDCRVSVGLATRTSSGDRSRDSEQSVEHGEQTTSSYRAAGSEATARCGTVPGLSRCGLSGVCPWLPPWDLGVPMWWPWLDSIIGLFTKWCGRRPW